jgi:hypothetical protein
MYHLLLCQETNVLPEDGRIFAAETCRIVYKCNCAVVGFINKFVYGILLSRIEEHDVGGGQDEQEMCLAV